MATLKPYRPAGGLGLAPETQGLVRPAPGLTLVDKRALCGIPAMLNGKPAAVTGAMEKTALVVTLDGTSRVEYSWPTVARLAANDIPLHGKVRFGGVN